MDEFGKRPRLRGEARRVAERTRAVLADAAGPATDDDADAARNDDAGAARNDDAGGWVDAPDLVGSPEPPAVARHRRRSAGPVLEPLRERVRWDPGRRATAAVALLALAAVLVTVWQVARSRPQPVSIQTSPGGLGTAVGAVSGGPDGLHPRASSVTASTTASASLEVVLVDVAGKVRRPGVYRLRPGARVIDAVRAAGGPRRFRDTASLNLAEPVTDGEQIVVGAPVAATAGAPPGGPSPSTSGGAAAPVDLNTATLEQLETLPGVGPVLGQNILDWRDAHGRFTGVDQLRQVTGIGDVRFAQLQPLVRLS